MPFAFLKAMVHSVFVTIVLIVVMGVSARKQAWLVEQYSQRL